MQRASWDHPCIVLDVDGTLCPTRQEGQEYADLEPFPAMVTRLQRYRAQGYYVILQTGRQMRTYEGNVGAITAHTVPVLADWLYRHGIPYDEIHVGRPWPGRNGFYVCDQTVTPRMLLERSPEEIREWLATQRP